MNGRFSFSLSNFHSAPSLFEISELCIFGFSWAIFRLWPRDQTIKAFIGRLICSLLCIDFADIFLKFFFLLIVSFTKFLFAISRIKKLPKRIHVTFLGKIRFDLSRDSRARLRSWDNWQKCSASFLENCDASDQPSPSAGGSSRRFPRHGWRSPYVEAAIGGWASWWREISSSPWQRDAI